jgi:hypothetical protein
MPGVLSIVIEDDAQGMLELARDGAELLKDPKPGDPEWERERVSYLNAVKIYDGFQFN